MNTSDNTKKVLNELRQIPGIGKACALDLYQLGIRRIADLEKQNPALLYHRLNAITGATHDVCMLYTFRCAVYFASEKNHEKKKLKWWYWKNKTYGEE